MRTKMLPKAIAANRTPVILGDYPVTPGMIGMVQKSLHEAGLPWSELHAASLIKVCTALKVDIDKVIAQKVAIGAA